MSLNPGINDQSVTMYPSWMLCHKNPTNEPTLNKHSYYNLSMNSMTKMWVRHCFQGMFSKWKILVDLQDLRSSNSKNQIFSGQSATVCESPIRITQKQINAKTPNLPFSIYILCGSYLKFFMNIGQTVRFYEKTKEFQYMSTYGRNFLLLHFNVFRLN